MPRFEPKNPDFREVATDTFDRQRAMQTLGISIARLEPGEVDLAMAYSRDLTQQNGFVHAGIITAGLDSACGIAAFTLMPAGSDRASVVKSGRTLTVCEGRAYALQDGVEIVIATMTGTLMALPRREGAQAQDKVRAPD